MKRRYGWLALVVLCAGATLQLQEPPTLRQLRQQQGYEIARLNRARTELDSALVRAQRVWDGLHARIVADSIAAVTAEDSVTAFPLFPSARLPDGGWDVPAGTDLQFCFASWRNGVATVENEECLASGEDKGLQVALR